MALRIQIAKFKFHQYLVRANSPNFPAIRYVGAPLQNLGYHVNEICHAAPTPMTNTLYETPISLSLIYVWQCSVTQCDHVWLHTWPCCLLFSFLKRNFCEMTSTIFPVDHSCYQGRPDAINVVCVGYRFQLPWKRTLPYLEVHSLLAAARHSRPSHSKTTIHNH